MLLQLDVSNEVLNPITWQEAGLVAGVFALMFVVILTIGLIMKAMFSSRHNDNVTVSTMSKANSNVTLEILKLYQLLEQSIQANQKQNAEQIDVMRKTLDHNLEVDRETNKKLDTLYAQSDLIAQELQTHISGEIQNLQRPLTTLEATGAKLIEESSKLRDLGQMIYAMSQQIGATEARIIQQINPASDDGPDTLRIKPEGIPKELKDAYERMQDGEDVDIDSIIQRVRNGRAGIASTGDDTRAGGG